MTELKLSFLPEEYIRNGIDTLIQPNQSGA